LSGSDYWTARLYTIAPCGSLAIPAPPINLAVSATGAGSVIFTWDDVATDETGFEVERSTNQTVWTQIATPAAGVETYTDLTATPQTLYYYRVRAVNANGNSAWAGPVSTTTSAMPDFGTFEYWQGGLLPSGGPNGLDNGNFEYWQAGLLPPVWTVV
jgi:predicted phage tail protein